MNRFSIKKDEGHYVIKDDWHENGFLSMKPLSEKDALVACEYANLGFLVKVFEKEHNIERFSPNNLKQKS